jgi:hypothetical protein
MLVASQVTASAATATHVMSLSTTLDPTSFGQAGSVVPLVPDVAELLEVEVLDVPD